MEEIVRSLKEKLSISEKISEDKSEENKKLIAISEERIQSINKSCEDASHEYNKL